MAVDYTHPYSSQNKAPNRKYYTTNKHIINH